jgi:hypothetical protein
MFNQIALKHCLVLILALAATACSSTDSRNKTSNRSVLPSSPMPQTRIQAPRNVYIPQVFDEYKPQRQPVYEQLPKNYGDYAPEKDYRDSYTTAIERQPPAVVEVLKPEPIQQEEPVKVEPLATKVEMEDFSKNELDIDPFAAVPDREVLAATSSGPALPPPPLSTQPMSRAAKALSLAAKAESALGRNDAAINKVERALRIQPQSPDLWYQLADLNFKKGRHDQAIGLARKALPMASGNRDLVEQTLNLMSKAAVKTGNTSVFKEVLDYKKQNF